MEKVDKAIIWLLDKKLYTLPSVVFIALLFSLDDSLSRLVVIISWLVFNTYVKRKWLERLGYGRNK